MTHDRTGLYDLRLPPPGGETNTIGIRRKEKVECVENMHVSFYGFADEKITLIHVSYVLGLGPNVYALHAIRKTHIMASDTSRMHIIDTNLTFPRSSSRSYLRATRLPAGDVGVKKLQRNMRANNLFEQLRHHIPPPPSGREHFFSRSSLLCCTLTGSFIPEQNKIPKTQTTVS